MTEEDQDWVKYLLEDDPEAGGKKKRRCYAVEYKKHKTLDLSERDNTNLLRYGPKTLPQVVKSFQFMQAECDFWAETGTNAKFFDDYCETPYLVVIVDPRNKDQWQSKIRRSK